MARSSRIWRALLWLSVTLIVLLVGLLFAISWSMKRRQAAVDSRMTEGGTSKDFLPLQTPPVHGIFAAVPYCVDLIGGAYIECDDTVCKAFRPKSAIRPAA